MASLWAKIDRECQRLVERLRPRSRTAEERRVEWNKVHQPFELRFHQGHNYRWNDEKFFGQWDEVFGNFLGLTKEHFGPHDTLLDLGCGSRPVLDWFDGPAERHFLDPLLDEFRQIDAMRPFWSQHPESRLISQPAELLAAHLAERCDFVNCWNVLDHTYDWRRILENIRLYSRSGALVCIGTDFESHGKGHPGIDDTGYFHHFLESHFDVVEKRKNYVHRELALKLIRR